MKGLLGDRNCSVIILHSTSSSPPSPGSENKKQDYRFCFIILASFERFACKAAQSIYDSSRLKDETDTSQYIQSHAEQVTPGS
ncbi:hypothetical protein ACH5RR_007859 [Cinchona calisaya]|uniref:Uncharacterized protein n=1 Tax=Cinchona calisaya TaxID=153742 RepID=A0ABD3AA18_9GENT